MAGKYSEKSRANLIEWQKGQSGNPSGRPKRRPITEAYILMGRRRVPKKIRSVLGLGPKATWSDAVALGQFFNAAKGRSANATEIREAIEGKATQRIELSGYDDAAPIQIATETVDLSKLTKEELQQYAALKRKAAR